MADETFKLPRSSYDELVKIVKAYGRFTEPVSLDEVSRLIGVNPTLISGNSGFLTGIGVLETGSRKQVTPKGKELALAMEHEMPDEIRRCWRVIVAGSEFLHRLLAAVKIRKGMDEPTLLAHVAYSAGQPKTPATATGARTIIDILRAAELVRESDGKFVAEEIVAIDANNQVTGTGRADVVSVTPGDSYSEDLRIELPRSIATVAASGVGIAVHVHIKLNISCAPNELDGIGARLRAVIDEVVAKPKSQHD